MGIALIYAMMGGSFGKDSGVETFSFFMGMGAFLGAGTILFMALNKVWTGSPQYSSALRDAVIAPAFILTAGLSMQFANRGFHPSFDYFLYRFDLSLGLTPQHSIVTLFRNVQWIRIASFLTYSGLLMFPPLFHGWATYKGKAAKTHLVHAFVIAGVVGFVLYHICPAVGPHVTFGEQYPDQLPVLNAVPMKSFLSTSVYNAMPSLHMTWASAGLGRGVGTGLLCGSHGQFHRDVYRFCDRRFRRTLLYRLDRRRAARHGGTRHLHRAL